MSSQDFDPKIADLANRMHNMTVGSNVTVHQAASAHFNCLATLALKDAEGDEEKAAKILRNALDGLVAAVHNPTTRKRIIVSAGVIQKIGGGGEH